MTSQSMGEDVGTRLAGRYRIESLIGHGGMASVYRAADESLGRTVALKVFRDAADADDVRRQGDEVQLLASLNHPNLVTLYDAVTPEEGTAFLVMEYVPGTDLRAHIEGGMVPTTVAQLGADVAEALGHIHSLGIIHRDVKPGNILVPDQASTAARLRAKLADFGIARLLDGARNTSTGSVMGTASYLSPEQALGTALTSASDVYSLGLVLLECLTGTRAYPGPALEAAAARLLRPPEIPAELPGAWRSLLSAMTAREPERRPGAAEVADRLHALTLAPSTEDPTLEWEPPTRRLPAVDPTASTAGTTAGRTPRRRTRLMLAAGAAAATLVAGAVIAGIALTPDAEPAPGIDYPAVEGELGRHLEQLQESVEP